MAHSLKSGWSVKAHKATQEGALDGFQAECHECGAKAAFSIESMTRTWAFDHVRLMTEWGK